MRLGLPRTLAGQLALLVAAALFVAQAVNFALLYSERRERSLNAVAAPAVARLAEAAERLAEGERPRARRLRRLRVTERSPVTDDMRRWVSLEARIADGLAATGIEIGEVRVAALGAARARWRGAEGSADAGGRRLAVVSAQLGDGRWLNMPVPLPPRQGRLVGWLLLQTAIIYAAVLVAVLWLGRRASRSLDRLAEAADAFGRSGSAVVPAPAGPEDIRRLAAAFNAMQARIAAMLTEKDRMLGAIGHDLRTPLAALRVRAEAVEDAEERARMVETIEEMSGTLDDILALARLGQTEEQPRPVDLTALVDAVAEDFRALGRDVEFEPSPRVAVVLRPGLTRRAIRNLVDNAVSYGGRARLRLRSGEEQVVLEIDDDGPGIPEDALEQVFEPFARLETSRSRQTGGTGLGLALAREIARSLGGDVTLQNRAGGGLRAALSLPAGEAAAP